MANLEYTVTLGANLAANFKTVFSDSRSQIAGLNNDIRTLQKTDVGRLGESFEKAGAHVSELSGRLQAARARLAELRLEAAKSGGKNAGLARQIALVEQEVNSLNGSLKRAVNRHQNVAASIRTESGSVSALMKDYRMLGTEVDRLAKRRQRLAMNQEARSANLARRGQLRGQLFDAAALGATVGLPVKMAVDFESGMADAAKTIDGMRDDAGALTPMYYEMVRQAKLLGRELPLAHDELASLMGAAGQLGLGDPAEIARFTKDAAMMAVAFGMSNDEAAAAIGGYRTALGLTQDEVRDMLDLMNYFANTSSATEAGVADIVRRVGALGGVAGVSHESLAALAATLDSMKISPENAATGLQNLMLAMTAGKAATRKQAMVMQELGFDAERLAERMQVDATGAILDFLRAVQRLPEHEQAAALNRYFGRESVKSIAPLLTQLDLLEANFKKAGEQSLRAGSMQKEFANRSATTAGAAQLAKNKVAELGIDLGSVLLPPLNAFLDVAGKGASALADLSGEFPLLTKVVGLAAGGLVTLAVASKAGGYAFTFVRGGLLTYQNALIRLSGLQRRGTLAARRQTLANQALTRSYERAAIGAGKAGAAAGRAGRKFGALGLAARAVPALLVFDVATSAIDSAYLKLMDLTGETERLKAAGFEPKGMAADFNSIIEAQIAHNPYGFGGGKTTVDAQGKVWDSVPIAGLSGTMAMIQESEANQAAAEKAVVGDALSAALARLSEAQTLSESLAVQVNIPVSIGKVSGTDARALETRLGSELSGQGQEIAEMVQRVLDEIQRNKERISYAG